MADSLITSFYEKQKHLRLVHVPRQLFPDKGD